MKGVPLRLKTLLEIAAIERVTGKSVKDRFLHESFKGGVKTPGDKDWVYNALRFATEQEADEYVTNLSMRWTAVQDTNVEKSDDPVNYKWENGKAVSLKEGRKLRLEYDPELPGGFQDDDFEMRDLQAAGDRSSRLAKKGICTHGWRQGNKCLHCKATQDPKTGEWSGGTMKSESEELSPEKEREERDRADYERDVEANSGIKKEATPAQDGITAAKIDARIAKMSDDEVRRALKSPAVLDSELWQSQLRAAMKKRGLKESLREDVGENGYLAFYNGKQMEIRAKSSYEAQQKAVAAFKPKKSQQHMVHVHLAEKDGKQVTHIPTEGKRLREAAESKTLYVDYVNGQYEGFTVSYESGRGKLSVPVKGTMDQVKEFAAKNGYKVKMAPSSVTGPSKKVTEANPAGKTRKDTDPYEIWQSRDGSWKWYVLKKWQTDDDKPYARWFCKVFTPMVPEGELGDVYVAEIKKNAVRVK